MFSFVDYIVTMSVSQAVWSPVVELFLNDELERSGPSLIELLPGI